MSREAPGPRCADHVFGRGIPLDEAAAIALEDYARTLLGAEAAFAVRSAPDADLVGGLHVCGLAAGATPAPWQDVEDFAREMAHKAGAGGLGWS